MTSRLARLASFAARTTAADRLSFAATVVAVGISLWHGFVAVARGQPIAAMDPMVGLTLLTVIGLIWYTYYTRALVQQAGEARGLAKRSISIALAADLDDLKAVLTTRKFGSRRLSCRTLDLALENCHLFEPEVVRQLVGLRTALRDLAAASGAARRLQARSGNSMVSESLRLKASEELHARQAQMDLAMTGALDAASELSRLVSQAGLTFVPR